VSCRGDYAQGELSAHGPRPAWTLKPTRLGTRMAIFDALWSGHVPTNCSQVGASPAPDSPADPTATGHVGICRMGVGGQGSRITKRGLGLGVKVQRSTRGAAPRLYWAPNRARRSKGPRSRSPPTGHRPYLGLTRTLATTRPSRPPILPMKGGGARGPGDRDDVGGALTSVPRAPSDNAAHCRHGSPESYLGGRGPWVLSAHGPQWPKELGQATHWPDLPHHAKRLATAEGRLMPTSMPGGTQGALEVPAGQTFNRIKCETPPALPILAFPLPYIRGL